MGSEEVVPTCSRHQEGGVCTRAGARDVITHRGGVAGEIFHRFAEVQQSLRGANLEAIDGRRRTCGVVSHGRRATSNGVPSSVRDARAC